MKSDDENDPPEMTLENIEIENRRLHFDKNRVENVVKMEPPEFIVTWSRLTRLDLLGRLILKLSNLALGLAGSA